MPSQRSLPSTPKTIRRQRADKAAFETPDEPGEAQAPASTRERILEAAERLFAEHGFDSVSMPGIAEASGITAGAIYKHFDGKADLFFEVVRRVVQSAPTPVASGEGARIAPLLSSLAAMYTTTKLKRLRQLAVEIHYASVKHPRVGGLLRQSVDGTIAEISKGVAGAQRAGELEPALDPELLASAVMAFIMGLMHMETLLPKLVGDAKWHDFVEGRVAALIGSR
ncbi:MAG: TetR/AcrR family transcriptional regulator [Hyphomicrobiales bacterium]|nr:TetR/AcrR family transcriptional regulator [Hyphomicrobiales bacterium]